MRRLFACAALAALTFGGCQYPRDPEGTLERVRGGVMRVGWTEHDPWVKRGAGGEPGGVEAALVTEFARRQGARIRWVEGAESEVLEALERRELDLVIAGLTRSSPWTKKVALTAPYVNAQLVVAGADEGPPPDDVEGVRVFVEANSSAVGLLEAHTGAEPVPVDSLDEAHGPVAAWDYQLDDLGRREYGEVLLDEEHCMAVPFGENAWMVELEHFLLDRGREASLLLAEEGAP